MDSIPTKSIQGPPNKNDFGFDTFRRRSGLADDVRSRGQSGPSDPAGRIGLVPKQHSSGGKNRLGSISKQGDRYLRGLFVIGALAVIRYAKIHGTKHRPWLTALLARKPEGGRHRACQQDSARMIRAEAVADTNGNLACAQRLSNYV
jgi:hypothetical protein